MDLGIDGRAALVCGASRGLGRATAEALVAEGARVMLCARDEASLADAARDLVAKGGHVETVAADISEPSLSERLMPLFGIPMLSSSVSISSAGMSPLIVFSTSA